MEKHTTGVSAWGCSYWASSQLFEIAPSISVEEQSTNLLPSSLPPVYFHAALFCKEPARGWCLPRESTAVPCFLWQINPRPFLVTIPVGCIPIKLFLLGFYFLYKNFFLVHSVPSLSGAFWGHKGLAQLALHNGLSGFWQCLLMATWPCRKELQGTAIAFVCLWSQPLIILSRSMRIAELVTLTLANTAVDVVSPCKHPIPF